MNKKNPKQFNLNTLVIAALLCVVALLADKYLVLSIPSWTLISLPIFGLIVSVLGYKMATSNTSKRNFSILLTSLFGIKFFSYLVLVLIFFIIEKEKVTRLSFTMAVFIVYIVNTVILLSGILKHLNGNNKKS